jgi:hypothetical protein
MAQSCGCLLSLHPAGCHAALPARQLLCSGEIAFGGHQALALPGQKLVMGNVQVCGQWMDSLQESLCQQAAATATAAAAAAAAAATGVARTPCLIHI